MKRRLKLFVNLLAVIIGLSCCFAFTGCREDIKTLEISVGVYNYEEKEEYEDVKLTVKLYRHLAPQTVDAILSYAKNGYYENTTFYKMSDYNSQIMVGDIVLFQERLELLAPKPQIEGEFEKGAVKGSNLVNQKGSIGLWRTWCAQDASGSKYNASNGFNSGRATWYIPTEDINAYNGLFCVFATIDLTSEANTNALNYISEALENTTSYVIFYQGEYDSAKADQNYGLSFNSMTSTEFNQLTDEEIEALNIFEAKDNEYVCYNKTTILVPTFTDGATGAYIKSIKVK